MTNIFIFSSWFSLNSSSSINWPSLSLMKNYPFNSLFLLISSSISSTTTNSTNWLNSIAANSALQPFYFRLLIKKYNFSWCLLSTIRPKPLTKSISFPTSQYSSKIYSQKCTLMIFLLSLYQIYINKIIKCLKWRCLMAFSDCFLKGSSIQLLGSIAATFGSHTTLMLSLMSPLKGQ